MSARDVRRSGPKSRLAESELTSRVPPHSLDAERSALGVLLLDKDAIPRVVEVIDSADFFYAEAHRLIFQAILELFDVGNPVDVVTLREKLRSQGTLEKVGGSSYLVDLIESVITTANVEYYANVVREKYILRGLLHASYEISGLVHGDSSDLGEVLDAAQSRIFQITRLTDRRSLSHIKDVLSTTFEHIEALYHKKEQIIGVPTGFTDMDRLTSGLQKSDLVVVAGRPSMGKTAFALNIVQYAACQGHVPCVVFSLESAKEQLVERMLCAEARVDSQKLRTGFLSEQDWSRLTDAAGILAESPIYIDDTPNISVMELRAKARRLKTEHDIGLAVIDYLQLMAGNRHAENRQQQISEISRSLKGLAKEIEIPLLAISQLSRAVEQREDKRPRLSDLRESGAIEQDADLVISLYRDFYYSHDSEQEKTAEAIISKQRRGPVDTVRLTFFSEYTRFDNQRT